MLKVSKKSQYGLRAMVLLAKNYAPAKKGQRVLSVKSMSKTEKISPDFLEKIVRQLAEAGLVAGAKGIKGGYFLAKPPKKINANNIVSVLEESKNSLNCSLCGRKDGCAAKNVWAKLDSEITKTLNSITLADLI